MSYDATQQAARRAKMRKHTIVEVGFQQAAEENRPMSEALILCSCSAEVTSGTWDSHRGILNNASRLLVKDE